MKTTKIMMLTILMMVAMVGTAQAQKITEGEMQEQYQQKVRETLALDYSMPDYSTNKVDAKLIGDRLTKILKKVEEMSVQQTYLGTLSILQSNQIDGMAYCTVKKIKLDKVEKVGKTITIVYNTELGSNQKNLKRAQLEFRFVNGVSDVTSVNDFFLNICRYIR